MPDARAAAIEVTHRLRALIRQGREIDVEFLREFAAVLREKKWVSLGYANVWEYARKELGLEDCAIFHRIHAAEILNRFPDADAYIADGRIPMTSITELKDVLTAENARELLDRAAGKNRDQVKAIAASFREPIPVPAASVRRLPAPRHASQTASPESAKSVHEAGAESASVPASNSVADPSNESRCAVLVPISPTPATAIAASLPVRDVPRPRVEPIARGQFKVAVVVDEAFVELLEKVKALESHSVPDGDIAALFRRGLEALAAKHDTRNSPRPRPDERRAEQERPDHERTEAPAEPPRTDETRAAAKPTGAANGSPARGNARPDAGSAATARLVDAREIRKRIAIPAAVRREVWSRDGGRCVWETVSGRCDRRWNVEIDHIVPVAKGGATTAANLRLLCRDHNERAARNELGDELVDRFKRRNG